MPAAAQVPASGPEILNNESVVKMVAGKVSRDLILSKIQSTQSNFDISAPGIIGLYQNKVSAEIIKSMMASPSSSRMAAEEVLDNGGVILMVTARLPQDLILAKIKNSRAGYDLTAAGLVTLNQNKVRDDVVKAMMASSASPVVATPAQKASTTSASTKQLPLAPIEKNPTKSSANPAGTSGSSVPQRAVQSGGSRPAILPTAYGWYALRGTKLSELPVRRVETLIGLSPVGSPNRGIAVDGIRGETSLRLDANDLQFIVFEKNVPASGIELARLGLQEDLQAGQFNDFKTRPEFFRSLYGKESTDRVQVNLWRPQTDEPLRVEPVPGTPDQYVLSPEGPIKPGRYALFVKGSLHGLNSIFATELPRVERAFYFMVEDRAASLNRTPLDSILENVTDSKYFDMATRSYSASATVVWSAIQKALGEDKETIKSSNNELGIILTQSVHTGVFPKLFQYYIWLDQSSPQAPSVHVKLMRYGRDVKTLRYSLREPAGLTKKAADAFLERVQSAIVRGG
ncbi:MAG: hypothetical protein ABJC26_07240 [Gemmatimonadaceae bacterium]